MGGSKGGSKPPPAAPVPTVDTAAENAKQLAEIALRRKGRRANILTGNMGVDTTEGVAQKKLLGGAK
jgi:hypothetical protein